MEFPRSVYANQPITELVSDKHGLSKVRRRVDNSLDDTAVDTNLMTTRIIGMGTFVWLLLMQSNTVTAQTSSDSNSEGLWVTAIAGILTLLATNFFQIYRESRNRKWDIADRQEQRRREAIRAQAQHNSTIQTAFELAKVATRNRDDVIAKVDENTALTAEAVKAAGAAYEAGNSFNAKLEALTRDYLERAGRIEETGSDTNVKVTSIAEEIKPDDDSNSRR